MEVKEYPYNFLSFNNIVEIYFGDTEYLLTPQEWIGVKQILGRNYLKSTEEEFKTAYFAEVI